MHNDFLMILVAVPQKPQSFFEAIAYIFEYLIFFYTLSILFFYIVLAILGGREIRKYKKKNDFVDYKRIITSPLTPSVTIVSRTHNEEEGIIRSIQSMLNVQYPKLEVIVSNDGSTDKTLEIITKAYDLEKIDFAYDMRIPCQPIKAIYRSKNPAYHNLMVVDKENGFMSDAVNAGINAASGEYVLAIDADTVIEPEALLKMIKCVMEEEDAKVISVGGVLGIANSCVVRDGKLVEVHMPKDYFPKVQAVEYFRSFLNGRMAWKELDGFMLVSGALGLYHKETLVNAGGLYPDTNADDMEVNVRLRRYMNSIGEPYKIEYVPEPLCWTSGPTTLGDLFHQRRVWAHGTMDVLWLHRGLFFNPKHGKLGLMGYPYFLFFEWFAPILELFGIAFIITAIIVGIINWPVFIILMLGLWAVNIMLTTTALYYEETSYHRYEDKKDLWSWLLASILEPFFYHPIIVIASWVGYFDFITGKKVPGQERRERNLKRKKPFLKYISG